MRAALTVSTAGAESFGTGITSDRIGRYKLLEKIGEGGYGIVYMAEQAEPIRRRVALKVVKLGMDTKQVIARFEAERQALALMDHPHIAKIFDAGATETGRPFFVMELVRGIKITDYCDQHRFSTRERLDLFIEVCHAIQHAHQKGIIHRDLKPSNILVSSADGVPVPKVIDFGIAKATNQQQLTDKTVFTAFNQFIGTPAYMSPEQAEMSALDIDTRSDIYSLGVLLYELLTGQTPFNATELDKAGFDEIRRIIREKVPQTPSTRLSTLDMTQATALTLARQTKLPLLINLVRGDLDWIVMKCLEKNRTRRYASADALAADLKRHLNDEPVTAAAPSVLYRMGKFVHRYRRGVIAAVLLLHLLALGSSAIIVQAIHLRRATQRTRVMIRFLDNTLNDVRSAVAAGRDATLMREVLDQAVVRLPQELHDQPEAQADLRLAMGFLYQDLKEYKSAKEAFLKASETYKELHGPRNKGVAVCTFGLALVSLKLGELPAAETNALTALTLCRRAFSREDVMVVHSIDVLGRVLLKQKHPEQALASDQDLLGNREAAELLKSYAGALQQQGKHKDAAAIFKEAQRILEAKTSPLAK